mmetsp:Transcript_145279/g.253552  ORF Transcript_145279/g.253552 Transcript_145279/m.253552 type:complete len:317 (-) Transcript_145279:160-1110(-)
MKQQQCCVFTNALVVVVLGLVLVLLSCLMIESSLIIRNFEPFFAPSVKGLGAILCIVGLVGVYGACSSSRTGLVLFGICSFSAVIAGITIGVALVLLANVHVVDLKQACSLEKQTGHASSKLVKPYQVSYDSMKEALENCRRNGKPDALGLEDCGHLARDSTGRWFEEDPRRDLFAWIEERSGCGGLCSGDLPLFAFPASPGGPVVDQSSKESPRSPCFDPLAGELLVQGSGMGSVMIILSLPLLIAVCTAFWIVCSPPPRTRKDYMHAPQDDIETDRLLEQYSSQGSTMASLDGSGSDEDAGSDDSYKSGLGRCC